MPINATDKDAATVEVRGQRRPLKGFLPVGLSVADTQAAQPSVPPHLCAGPARRGFASRPMPVPENSRGYGLRTLLFPHFEGASTVVVQDGYVRTQLERLRELAELARGAGVRRLEVVAKPWRPGEVADVDPSDEPDPLAALMDSIGGITWSLRASTLHHDRQVKILRDDGAGTTVDWGRGLDMYSAA